MNISKRDYKFFEVAAAAAATSHHKKAQIGAVIVSNKHILSVGVNQHTKTHPMQKQYNVHRYGIKNDTLSHCTHAEIDAISKAKNTKMLKQSRIYVSRVKKDGSLGMCRPCPACLQALGNSGISEIFYTTDLGYAHEVIC